MTLSEYSQLKQQVVVAVNASDRHSDILKSIKEIFKEGINSVRRFEQINSVGHLLRVLEIRDLLSDNNVGPLKDIAQKLQNNEVFKRIADFERYHRSRENFYSAAKQYNNTAPTTGFVNVAPVANIMSEMKKKRIYETIGEEIGTHWRDLARNLNIREVEIDNIESSNNTLSKKAFSMLELYTTKADPERWFFKLQEGLEKTRRKDLVRSMQEIVLMNI